MWTNVSKPTGTNYTNIAKPSGVATIGAGYYMGPLGLTYSDQIILTNWVNVSKPTTSFTNIAKP